MSNWSVRQLEQKGLLNKVKGAEIKAPPLVETIPTGIYIPGEVISSKNSKQIAWRDGKPFITHSQAAKRYKDTSFPYYLEQAPVFKELVKNTPRPFYCAIKFLRKTKGRFDCNNLTQMVADLMVEAGWIEDDHDGVIRFIPINTEYGYKNPGVVIFA